MRRRMSIVITVAALGMSALVAAASQAAGAGLPLRPDQADWQKIQAAAHFRNIGLARHRTAHFRSLAGRLGLSELTGLQPLAAGRCRLAVRSLYGNLLDLQDAVPGENWTPLRRFVAREPSIRACAPSPRPPR